MEIMMNARVKLNTQVSHKTEPGARPSDQAPWPPKTLQHRVQTIRAIRSFWSAYTQIAGVRVVIKARQKSASKKLKVAAALIAGFDDFIEKTLRH